jgi:hypothetical protein
MGNSTTTTPTTTPADDAKAAAVLAQFEQAISGLQNDVPATQPIVYKQISYTATTFLPVLQAGAAPLLAVATARATLNTALTNRHTAFDASKALIDAFFVMLPQILPPGTDVSQFGAKARKARTPQTAAQKAASNAKRQATRQARHIMGKKQRAAIQAPAATSPTTGATTTGTTASGATAAAAATAPKTGS